MQTPLEHEPFATDELFAQARDGDHEAYSQLERRIRRWVHHQFHGRIPATLHTRYATEDLMQDAFLRIFERDDAFVPKEALDHGLRAWLRRVISNRLLDLVRSKEEQLASMGRVQAIDGSSQVGTGFEESLTNLHENPHQIAEYAEYVSKLLLCMSELSETEQHILRARYQEGSTFVAIAEGLGISEAAVRRAHERILRDLQRKLPDSESSATQQ